MGENEQTPLTKADLARHWGVSRPYVTKLAKPEAEGGKAMPTFTDLAEADAWRAVHAAPRSARVESVFAGEQSSPVKPTEAAEKSPVPTSTTTGNNPAATTGGGGRGKGKRADALAHLMPDKIDVAAMIRRDVDFDVLMVGHAEEVPQIAHGLFRLAAESGHPSAISAATRNWHESATASAGVRERFLAIQEKSRALLPLDEVMDIVGTELQPIRTAISKLGEKCALEANPSDPALARRVIDEAVDRIIAGLYAVEARAQRELSAPAP